MQVLLMAEQSYYTEYLKMSKPTIQIHNIETGEIVEREMNAAELSKYNKGIELANNMKAEIEAKAAAKALLLKKLGITAEEAALLLS